MFSADSQLWNFIYSVNFNKWTGAPFVYTKQSRILFCRKGQSLLERNMNRKDQWAFLMFTFLRRLYIYRCSKMWTNLLLIRVRAPSLVTHENIKFTSWSYDAIFFQNRKAAFLEKWVIWSWKTMKFITVANSRLSINFVHFLAFHFFN